MADPKKPVVTPKPDLAPKVEAKPEPKVAGPLCDVSKCSVVKIKSDKGVVKTLHVAPNMRPELLVFASEMGPDANLVTGCADGWTFVSAE